MEWAVSCMKVKEGRKLMHNLGWKKKENVYYSRSRKHIYLSQIWLILLTV